MFDTDNLMVLINPFAGLLNTRNRLPDVEHMLRRRLPGAGFVVPESEDHAARILRRAVKQHVRRVIVVGGDGTVHHAARILAGTSVELGLVPLGSANNIAGSLGIPDQPRAALRLAAGGCAAPMDVGRCGKDIFLEAAGLGFHADILHRYAQKHRKSLVRGTYAVIRTLAELKPFDAVLRVDGQTRRHSVFQMTINNLPMYGTNFRTAPQALPDDGFLDVTIIPHAEVSEIPALLMAARQGRLHEWPGVQWFQCRELRVRTAEPVPVHLDADARHMTPAIFRIAPSALRIVRPPAAP